MSEKVVFIEESCDDKWGNITPDEYNDPNYVESPTIYSSQIKINRNEFDQCDRHVNTGNESKINITRVGFD